MRNRGAQVLVRCVASKQTVVVETLDPLQRKQVSIEILASTAHDAQASEATDRTRGNKN